MILSDAAILEAIEREEIVIEPFDRKNLGPNSYDVHLSQHIKVYTDPYVEGETLDCAKEPCVLCSEIESHGMVLRPGVLYLGSTLEYTETKRHVPYIDGKSSVGRLGISVHVTAGRGDVGFRGHWTLEITVVHPTRVYAGTPIGQLTYHTVEGMVLQPYDKKSGGAGYCNRDPRPQPSRLWKKMQRSA